MGPRAAYKQVLAEHRARLVRLAEHRGVARLRAVYTSAEAEVMERVERVSGPGRSPWTAGQQRAVLAQVRHGQSVMAASMAGELGDATRDAQLDTLRGTIREVKLMRRAVTGMTPVLPVEEAARFAGVVDRRRTSLLRQHRSSMAAFGGRLVGQIEGDLAVSLISGDTTDQAIERIRSRTQGEFWQAERIVRTETAWASNSVVADGVHEMAKTEPDLWMRWSEHVTDDGAPMDDRVGEDSIVMHGQVARPGGLFTMPPDPRVDAKMWGLTWGHPPNRPNDRAVLVPFSPTWGTGELAWRFSGGVRVPV